MPVQNKPSVDDLKLLLNDAIKLLYIDNSNTVDYSLIKRGLQERTIAFRLGIYLNDLIRADKKYNDYNLDSEYNKNGDDLKITPSRPHGSQPDIILHKRTLNDNNLLVVEIKREANKSRKKDRNKLKDFTDSQGIYKFSLGVFIILTEIHPTLEYYIDGKKQ